MLQVTCQEISTNIPIILKFTSVRIISEHW